MYEKSLLYRLSKMLVCSTILLSLPGCLGDNGPSESEIKGIFEARAAMSAELMKKLLPNQQRDEKIKIEKHGCTEKGMGIFECKYRMIKTSLKTGDVVYDKERTSFFVKRDGYWYPVG